MSTMFLLLPFSNLLVVRIASAVLSRKTKFLVIKIFPGFLMAWETLLSIVDNEEDCPIKKKKPITFYLSCNIFHKVQNNIY